MKSSIIENIMKVADIDYRNVSLETITFLRNKYTYEDIENQEHLYALGSLLEKIDYQEEADFDLPTQSVINEIKKIHKQISKRGCSYLRIIIQ